MFHSKLKERGFQPVFRSQASNTCPGCGRSHWLVGRSTAECAFCATALPIAECRPVILAVDAGIPISA